MDKGRISFVTDTLLTFFSPIAQHASALIVLVFITKHVGAAGYGIWSQFAITIMFASVFIHLNLGHAMGRFFVGKKENMYLSRTFSALLTVVVILAVIVGFLGVFLREPIAHFLFDSTQYVHLLWLLAAFLVLRNLNAEHGAFLRARRYIKFLTGTDIVYFSITAVLVAIGAVFFGDISKILAVLLIVDTALLITYRVFLHKKRVIIAKPSFSGLFPLLRFGPPLILTSMGYWVVQLGDRYIIGYFMGIGDVGLYAASYGIATIILLFWVAFQTILFPDLSALYDQGEKHEIELRFARALKYGFAVSCGAVAGFVVLGRQILEFLSSAEFVEAYAALVVVSIGMLCYGVFMQFAVLLNVLQKVKVLNLFWFVMALVNISGNLVLVPWLGIMGAAYATLSVFVFGMVGSIMYIRPFFSIAFEWSWVVKVVISVCVMAGLVYLIPVSSILTLVFAIAAGVAIYAGVLFFIRFPDAAELSFLKKFIRQFTIQA